jgi:glycosyl transferase family 25
MCGDLSFLAADAALCISLKERADRRKLFEAQFSGTGLNVEYVLVDRDSEDPQRGCYNSHQLCAKLAIERGYQRVLIFEDDATLESVGVKVISRINNFLKAKDPEIFYLGVILGKIWLTWHPGVARVRAQGAHAYMLSAEGCRKVIELGAYRGKAIDNFYSKMFVGFCGFPMLSQQQPENICTSDIQSFRGGGVGYVDSFWKGNCRRQYWQVLKGLPKTLLRRGF